MMKRLWFGVGLLLLLLLGTLGVTWQMERIHGPVSTRLEQASQLAQQGNIDAAAQLAQEAQAQWKKHWHFSATFADHNPMEEADGLFAELDAYLQAGDTAEFTAACAHLARLTQAMAEAHGVNWWNLL